MNRKIIFPRVSANTIFILLFLSLTAVFLFLTLGSVILGHLSLTYDEPQHFKYGELIYNLQSDRFDDSKMPVSVLNVIPSKVAEHFFGNSFSNQWQVMSIGRITTIFVSWLLAVLCFIWIKSLYGKWVGLIGFGLYVFEPNIIAHSQLITTDIYAAATVTLSLFAFWKFLEKPDLKRAVLAGLALGLCQIAKYSGILLYPILILLIFLRYGGWVFVHIRQRGWRNLVRGIWIFIKYCIVFLITSIVVINVGFLFNRTAMPLGNYQFKSSFFQSLQKINPLIDKMPIPLPYPYVEGLDFVMFRERTGDGYGNIYLLGQLRQGVGFPGYFLVASLFKIPISILILFGVSLWGWLRSFRWNEFLKVDMFFVVPGLVYSIYFNFFFEAQIGIRFLLVIFPIMLIFITRFFKNWSGFSKRLRILSGLAGIYLVVSVLSYFPFYLSYFNELVLDRTQSYRILADSNIDWGQNKAELTEFLSQHPDYSFEPTVPTAGTVVVGVNELIGVVGKPEDFQWLRERFKPVGNFRYSYLIYNISPSEIN